MPLLLLLLLLWRLLVLLPLAAPCVPRLRSPGIPQSPGQQPEGGHCLAQHPALVLALLLPEVSPARQRSILA